jgi:hypothetical protein
LKDPTTAEIEGSCARQKGISRSLGTANIYAHVTFAMLERTAARMNGILTH